MNEELMKEIAEYCTEVGLDRTSNGSCNMYFDEIAEAFNIDIELVKENADEISENIGCLIDIEILDEYFSMMFELEECCKRCATFQDGNRCYEECENCDCWCDEMDEDYEPEVIEHFSDPEREELKVGDIVYCNYLNRIGKLSEITEDGLYVIDELYVRLFHGFVRKATEDEIKFYNAQLAAKKWLIDRQEELKELKFRFYETPLWKEQKELLIAAGYFVYDLRDWDSGNGYNIEVHVVANNIGNWITDTDLTPYMNDNCWIGIDELKYADTNEIQFQEIKDILEEGHKLHMYNKMNNYTETKYK